jgi:hypothetical protein
VLGPADRVAEGARALASRVVAQRLADLEELLARDAAGLLDELGCVAGEVLAQQLVDAARVLEGLVVVRRLAVLERAPVGAVGGLADGAPSSRWPDAAAACMSRYCQLSGS